MADDYVYKPPIKRPRRGAPKKKKETEQERLDRLFGNVRRGASEEMKKARAKKATAKKATTKKAAPKKKKATARKPAARGSIGAYARGRRY